MDLKIKYSKLISTAQEANVKNLSVAENNNVLHITGTTSPAVKEKLWNLYNDIDPDMRSGDLVMNIQSEGSSDDEVYVVQAGDNLSKIAKNFPGMTWQKIYELNKDTIQDPNKIFPGQKLRIPSATK